MTQTQAEPKLWSKDFVLIAVVNLLLFASWQTLPFIFPLHLQELGVSDSLLGWITAITTIAAILIRPFCGFILDRFGRRGIFLLGIFLMGLSSAAYLVFPAVGILFVIRFIHGLAWGISSTSSQTVASDTIPPKRFGEGMGMFALSASLALAIAPGLAFETYTRSGFSSVVIIGIVALAIAFVIAFFLKYKTVDKPTKFRFAGMLEKRSALPACIMFFLSATYGALTTFLAIHALNQGVDNIGLFFTIYAVAVALSRPLLGKLIDKKGYALVLVPGLILLAIAQVVLAFASTLSAFLLVALIFGFGFAGSNSTLQAMAVAGVPLNRRGAANATYLVGFDCGIGFGAVISGIIAAAIGYSGLYLCFTAMPLIALVLYLALARHRKPPSLTAQEVD
ncbi:MAG: MFS transporter [Raoultibacter sp.]|jgi:MFS family permease